MKGKYFVFSLLIFLFLQVSSVFAQSFYAVTPEEKEFFRRISVLTEKIQNQNPKRLSKFRAINRSYESVQIAIRLFQSPGNLPEIERALQIALDQHPKNFIAALLLGVVYNDQGQKPEAARYYTIFLKESPFFTDAEKKLIDSEEVQYFRAYITNWFYEHGFELPEIKPPPSHRLRRGLSRLNVFPEESMLGILLTIFTFGGLAVLLFQKAIYRFEVHLFTHPLSKFASRFYFSAVLAYIIWMLHLFSGLGPFFGGTLVREIIIILTAGAILAITYQVYEYWQEQETIKKDPSYMLCPKCRKVILRVAAECDHCGAQV